MVLLSPTANLKSQRWQSGIREGPRSEKLEPFVPLQYVKLILYMK